jgi:hypothetical protein
MGNKIFRGRNLDSKSGETVESKANKLSESQTYESKVEKSNECSICLSHSRLRAKTNACIHLFCYRCIYEWAKVNKSCPVCRMPFDYLLAIMEYPTLAFKKSAQTKYHCPELSSWSLLAVILL